MLLKILDKCGVGDRDLARVSLPLRCRKPLLRIYSIAYSMKILLIEDDTRIAAFISKSLQQMGFASECASDGVKGLQLATEKQYEAAIVDLMLPKLDGLTVIERLRESGIGLPVLILSAKHEVDDRVRGLQSGGDDYLTKPFAFSELFARLQALLRRAKGTAQPTAFQVGDLQLNCLTREVKRAGQIVELQPREFDLLKYLMENAGRIVTKTMIIEHVWNYNFDPQTNVIEARICKLREKIDHGREQPLIQTVRGVGYVIKSSEHH